MTMSYHHQLRELLVLTSPASAHWLGKPVVHTPPAWEWARHLSHKGGVEMAGAHGGRRGHRRPWAVVEASGRDQVKESCRPLTAVTPHVSKGRCGGGGGTWWAARPPPAVAVEAAGGDHRGGGSSGKVSLSRVSSSLRCSHSGPQGLAGVCGPRPMSLPLVVPVQRAYCL